MFFLLSSFLLIILLLFNLYLLPSSIKRGHGQRQQRDQRGRQQQRGQRVRVRLFFFFFLCVHLFFISLFFFSHYFLSHKYINMQCRTGRDKTDTGGGSNAGRRRGLGQVWPTDMSSFCSKYSFSSSCCSSSFTIISFSVERDKRREGRGGVTQAQRVRILPLLFFLLSSFLLLVFIISFSAY